MTTDQADASTASSGKGLSLLHAEPTYGSEYIMKLMIISPKTRADCPPDDVEMS
jgi:hypothetical protein